MAAPFHDRLQVNLKYFPALDGLDIVPDTRSRYGRHVNSMSVPQSIEAPTRLLLGRDLGNSLRMPSDPSASKRNAALMPTVFKKRWPSAPNRDVAAVESIDEAAFLSVRGTYANVPVFRLTMCRCER